MMFDDELNYLEIKEEDIEIEEMEQMYDNNINGIGSSDTKNGPSEICTEVSVSQNIEKMGQAQHVMEQPQHIMEQDQHLMEHNYCMTIMPKTEWTNATSEQSTFTSYSSNEIKPETTYEFEEELFVDESGVLKDKKVIDSIDGNQKNYTAFNMEENDRQDSIVSVYDSMEEKFNIEEQFINDNTIYDRKTFFNKNEDNQTNYAHGKMEEIFEQEKINIHIHNENLGSAHSDERKYKCHLCDYEAGQKTTLKRHIDAVHLNIKKHQCSLCKYSAAAKFNLMYHLKSVHSDEKKHKCHLCNYETVRKGDLKQHIDTVHSKKMRKNQCQFCEYTSVTKGNLSRHIDTVHLKIKNYHCSLCTYSAARKESLTYHLEYSHSGEEPV